MASNDTQRDKRWQAVELPAAACAAAQTGLIECVAMKRMGVDKTDGARQRLAPAAHFGKTAA